MLELRYTTVSIIRVVPRRIFAPIGDFPIGVFVFVKSLIQGVRNNMRAKICGIKDLLSAKVAEEAGADFIGFVFYKKSQRYVNPDVAAVISGQVHQSRKVGVFVDEELEHVNSIARRVQLDYVQLHGHEDADYAAKIEYPVIKAYNFDENFSAKEANDYPAEIILIDTCKKGFYGGTGETFDWRAAAEEVAKINKSVLIAGGVDEENIYEINKIFHPFGVDVSSSLEVNHEKSIDKIKSFMKRIK